MFKNFNEKSFTEKIIRILTAISLLVGIPYTIKQIWFSEDKETETITSGPNSPIINGNGNTYNNNTYTVHKNETTSPKKEKQSSPHSNDNLKLNPEIKKIGKDEKDKIAILPFENLSQNHSYEWLSKGLAEALLEPISKSGKYIVLEGALRNKVTEEIDFQQGKYVDIKSAVKIGKMLGAKNIIIGSYQINNNHINITSRIVDVESSKIIENSTSTYEDSVLEPFQMQKNFSNYFYKRINE